MGTYVDDHHQFLRTTAIGPGTLIFPGPLREDASGCEPGTDITGNKEVKEGDSHE